MAILYPPVSSFNPPGHFVRTKPSGGYFSGGGVFYFVSPVRRTIPDKQETAGASDNTATPPTSAHNTAVPVQFSWATSDLCLFSRTSSTE